MKTKIITARILAIFLAFTMFIGTSCSDDDDNKNPDIKVSVSDIEADAAIVSWNLVSDQAFVHNIDVINKETGDVEFSGATSINLTSSEVETSIEVYGLTKLTEYTVEVTAISILENILGTGTTDFTTTESTPDDGGDDDGNGSGEVDFTEADIVGRWETSNMYYVFNDDKSGEYGQPSEMFGDEKMDDITWEVATFTVDEFDLTTGELNEREVTGVRATDTEEFYTDFEVVKNDDGSISLIDHANSDTYSKVDDGGDDDGGDGDDNSGADEGDMVIESVKLPGVFEAEYFMNGGEGVGYHDNDEINNGTADIRVSGVDIHPEANASNGYRVGWTNDGEWLKFKGSIETGDYLVKVSYSGEGTIGITLAGEYKEFDLPATGSHDTYNTVTISEIFTVANAVTEAEVMKAEVVYGGFDMDKFEVIEDDGSTAVPYILDDFIGEWKGGDYILTVNGDKTGLLHTVSTNYDSELTDLHIENYTNSSGDNYGWCLVGEWLGFNVVFQIDSKDKLIHKGGFGDTELTKDGETDAPELVFFPSGWETTDANGITDRINVVSESIVDFYGNYGGSSQDHVVWTVSFNEDSKSGNFYDNGNDVGEFSIDENNVMTFWNKEWTKVMK